MKKPNLKKIKNEWGWERTADVPLSKAHTVIPELVNYIEELEAELEAKELALDETSGRRAVREFNEHVLSCDACEKAYLYFKIKEEKENE